MKKKILTMLLAAALIAGLLSGCGDTSDTVKTTEEAVEKEEVTEATEAETEKTLSADGITVTGLMGSAEKVERTAVTDGDDYKSATDFVATLTDKNVTATEVYNINLLDKFGVNAQPDGSMKISLTLSDDFVNAEGDGYEVYRKEDDNTFTKLTASVDKKEISFDTEHFSIYVFVKTSSTTVAVGEPDSEAADNGEADQTQIQAAEYASDSYLSTEQPKQSTSNTPSDDNGGSSEPIQDSTPAQQPEQTQPAEPEQPAPANNCPYPLLNVTTYEGHTGFFYTNDQRGTEEYWNAYDAACQAVGGQYGNSSIYIGNYDDTGTVKFCWVFSE